MLSEGWNPHAVSPVGLLDESERLGKVKCQGVRSTLPLCLGWAFLVGPGQSDSGCLSYGILSVDACSTAAASCSLHPPLLQGEALCSGHAPLGLGTRQRE